MKTALALITGLCLGWIAHQEMRPPTAAATPTPVAGFTFDRNKIICDKGHTSFDAQDNTYCMDTSAIQHGRLVSPAR
jgi:hypothetical protein